MKVWIFVVVLRFGLIEERRVWLAEVPRRGCLTLEKRN